MAILSWFETQKVDPIEVLQLESILDFAKFWKHASFQQLSIDTFFQKQYEVLCKTVVLLYLLWFSSDAKNKSGYVF